MEGKHAFRKGKIAFMLQLLFGPLKIESNHGAVHIFQFVDSAYHRHRVISSLLTE